MSNLFYPENPPKHNTFIITGDDVDHIKKSLRYKEGKELKCLYEDILYDCKIEKIDNTQITLCIIQQMTLSQKKDTHIHLYLSIPRPQTLKELIPMSNEIGIDCLTPVITQRSFFQNEDRLNLNKLQKIALESSKQCLRPYPIDILPPIKLKNIDFNSMNDTQKILCYEKETQITPNALMPIHKKLSIFIGCEGGFDEEEASFLISKGYQSCKISPNILKVPTAIISAISTFQTLQNIPK